jgi:arginine decarboxylase
MKAQYKIHDTLLSQENQHGLVIGNRIPMDYFETTGVGESDIAIHAGSYHLALRDAGIERYNIMTYSSILPKIAHRIDKPEDMKHGAVLESIMAVCTANKGEQATAGIGYGWLFDKKSGDKFGGLVCEHYGKESEKTIRHRLQASLEELYHNGFSDDYLLKDLRFLTKSFVPAKKYGTALVALCFTSYYFPIL